MDIDAGPIGMTRAYAAVAELSDSEQLKEASSEALNYRVYNYSTGKALNTAPREVLPHPVAHRLYGMLFRYTALAAWPKHARLDQTTPYSGLALPSTSTRRRVAADILTVLAGQHVADKHWVSPMHGLR